VTQIQEFGRRADGYAMPSPTFDSTSSLLRRLAPWSHRRWLLTTAALLTTLLIPAGQAQAAGYVNPFAGEQPYVGRTDMGVDLCLYPGNPIRAVGNGVVVGIQKNWSQGQPYIWYQLTDGPDAGQYVYVAEQIKGLPRLGQTLQAGDIVARYANHGTCIETGWSTADGETLADATTGYTEGEVTKAGISFAHFLISVGVPGMFELSVPQSQTARTKHKHAHHPASR
jgi:murein DD-endopeptidase MepM/ murein hydrolase activator NlpD